MALLTTDCPHCGTTKSGMPIFGVRTWPIEKKIDAGSDRNGVRTYRWNHSIAAMCQNCFSPICAVMNEKRGVQLTEYPQYSQSASKRLLGDGNAADMGFTAMSIWPIPSGPTIPANLPPMIERAMLQAERNYPVEGNEEASAMMYRRALELALKDLYPTLEGGLAKRIKQIVKEKILPQAIGDWADEIRELGNDAAHEPDEVPRDQLTMIRGFADATLRYLYTLPAEVAARRKPPSQDANLIDSTDDQAPAAGR